MYAQVEGNSDRLKDKLMDDLNAAKTNSIRESMRRTQMDLGNFYYDRADFASAAKCYMRARDHCATGKQVRQHTWLDTTAATCSRLNAPVYAVVYRSLYMPVGMPMYIAERPRGLYERGQATCAAKRNAR